MNSVPTTVKSSQTIKYTETKSIKTRQSNLLEFEFPAIHRRYKHCYKCDAIIFYDASVRSSKGKIIPRDKSTGLLHCCPGRSDD